jgi:hypothetical protein
MFELSPFGVAYISRIEGFVEVIEQLHFGSLGDPDEIREVTVSEAAKPLGDVPRRGPRRVSDLFVLFEVSCVKGPATKRPDGATKRVRQLPRAKLLEGMESRHAHRGATARPR